MLSRVWLSATPWTAAHQNPLSMGFPRQKYWSGLPFPPPGFLVNITNQFKKFLKSVRWSIGDIQNLKLFKYPVKTDIISLLPLNLIITLTLILRIIFIFFKNMNTWDVQYEIALYFCHVRNFDEINSLLQWLKKKKTIHLDFLPHRFPSGLFFDHSQVNVFIPFLCILLKTPSARHWKCQCSAFSCSSCWSLAAWPFET